MTNTLPISDTIYRIEAEIGAGGGGVVYKAWHTRLQKHVIIKELKNASRHDLETQRNEVEALKNVKSAYLPQVFDFITEGDRIFTVMEFIEGDSLDKLLERGRKFTQPQVVKWYGQLASALAAIHKQNVCHRDIKPANIMLMPDGDVCLIDFNAALVGGNDVQLVSRSLGYASPEQYEIYERFKSARSTPIHLGNSNITAAPLGGTQTEHLGESERTEFIDDDKTELIDDAATEFFGDDDAGKTEYLAPSATAHVDWQRSDIYSLGATMYHLLTGARPAMLATEVVPPSKLGRFSEGVLFIIEQSMKLNPSERFDTATTLTQAVQNIHKHDTRWRISRAKRIAAGVALPALFTLFATTALLGRNVMAQEKEERYYSAVCEIAYSAEPQRAYDDALAMYWDRIDPYLAMAKRLWLDGELDACREFVEKNLGNIAEFQNVSSTQRSFGDIYYILGNCYYFQSGEPNYHVARGNFEIAVQFVTDNPVYYRDYAISLARTGSVDEAEQVLDLAQSLHLDADSSNLLSGEIAFAKREYDDAIDDFARVIATTDDDYLRYRAYHTSDEIFKLQGAPEKSAELLSAALQRIPLNRVSEMTERLADAYVKCGDFESAIALFEQLADGFVPQFHILHGLAILYQNVGEFDLAAAVLDELADAFPNDYRVPMRKAYLEAERQSQIANETRDYAAMKLHYDSAIALHTANARDGESDPEMQQLDALIEQLRANKWID